MKKNLDFFFALGYIPHRLWGKILIAQLLEKDQDSMYYVTGEVLLKDENSLSYQKLSPMQKEVVNIIHEYNDVKLHKLFSKKRTVKEFQDSVDKETVKEHVRPYIERYIFQALQIAAKHRFKVFLKEKSNQNIFSDDFLDLKRSLAEPLFHFYKLTDYTRYSLSLKYEGKPVNLINEDAELICNSPAAIRIEKNIYFIENIEARKLSPFFKREFVEVPKASEKKYYSTFIANTLKAYNEVEAQGFFVKDSIAEKSATLSLEIGMQNMPVWVLSLRYNNVKIFPASKQKRFVNLKVKGDNYYFDRFSRDNEWEDGLDVALEEIGLKTRDKNGYYLRKGSSENNKINVSEPVNFINEHYDYLVENGFKIEQKLDKNYYLRPIILELESTEKEDWFDLRAIVRFGEFSVPFIKLRKHILSNERFFNLPDGSVAVIPEEWFARYRSLFEFGKNEGDRLLIHKQHFSLVDDSVRLKHASTIRNLEKLNRAEGIAAVKVPLGLKVNLRDYQMEGYAWLALLQENGFGGCLADDMGLGKTLQTIAILQRSIELFSNETHESTPDPGQLSLFGEGSVSPTSLVVVPASLIQNWCNEIARFAPALKSYAHAGTMRKRSTESFKYADVIISSYHTVRQDIDMLRDFDFHYVILDESQMIKNPHSKLYRAMSELQARHKLVLTGTPIENSLTDLWSQINFVNEGLLGSLNFFKKQFVKTIEKKKNREQEQRLKELINPFILRRTKEEVAKELPPLYEQYRYCNMTDEQKRLYEEEKSTVRNNLLENLEEIGLERSTMMVLKALTKLRQLSNHPGMVDEDYEFDSGKYDEVFRNIESVVLEGHKVLVFSSFVKHLNIYQQELDARSWKYARLTGSTTDRAAQVTLFQEDPECQVFLISLKAGGVGLNLTAADYVFILDPWWNPAAEMQALNRAHRIGQDKSVFVYRFISNHTVEEKILRLQERKTELAKTFVTSNNPLRNMKQEEILELFT